MKYLIFTILVVLVMPVHSATTTTLDVVITRISSHYDQGHILIQTTPRPDITGLGCTNDYWLMLYKTDTLAFQSLQAMLLTAYTTKATVIIDADDSNGGTYCRLSRVTLR